MDLLFGIHCHQPFNNFYEIVEEATVKSYLPFLKELSRFDKIKINIHYSGWLFNWLKDYSKETFSILKKLCDNGQVEFFTSGFYEPILSILPEKNAALQIEKSNKFIKNHFGQTPKGLWLTERVWEDKLVKVVVNCGVKYVVVDDYHFYATGFKEEDIYGYYLTESEGNALGIFPINKKLRYLIPFKDVSEISDYFQNIPCGIIFDDGEKFGLWPKTFEWIYEKNWLNDFFQMIEENNNVKSYTFNEFYLNNKPLGRVYLPEVSYYEMGEWALDYEHASTVEKLTEQYNLDENILRTGIWKNFFIKYEESNNIHKRIIHLSNAIKNKNLRDKATDFLMQSECNDCLWHGVFGGIYLPILRNNAYIAINKAENIIEKDKKFPCFEKTDINFDGYNELIMKNRYLTVIASSKLCGQIYEISDRESCFNFLNTLSRKKELYHDKIINHQTKKSEDTQIATIHELDFEVSQELQDALIFDSHLKYSFIDKFFKKEETFLNYKRGTVTELGDFIKKNAQMEDNCKFIAKGNIVAINRKFPVTISKDYFLSKTSLTANILCKNLSFVPFDLVYCNELNFFFPGHNDKNSYIEIADNKFRVETDLSFESVGKITVFDAVTEKNILIEANIDFKLWSYPFYSVSKSEKGFEKIYQGSTIGLLFPFDCFPNKEKLFKITITFKGDFY